MSSSNHDRERRRSRQAVLQKQQVERARSCTILAVEEGVY